MWQLMGGFIRENVKRHVSQHIFESFGDAYSPILERAVVLLVLYYVAAPPFVGLQYSMPMEGSYVIVNKVLIELAAVVVLLVFPTGKLFGLDQWISRKRNPAGAAAAQANT